MRGSGDRARCRSVGGEEAQEVLVKRELSFLASIKQRASDLVAKGPEEPVAGATVFVNICAVLTRVLGRSIPRSKALKSQIFPRLCSTPSLARPYSTHIAATCCSFPFSLLIREWEQSWAKHVHPRLGPQPLTTAVCAAAPVG